MRTLAAALAAVTLLATGACAKKQPAPQAPQNTPAPEASMPASSNGTDAPKPSPPAMGKPGKTGTEDPCAGGQ